MFSENLGYNCFFPPQNLVFHTRSCGILTKAWQCLVKAEERMSSSSFLPRQGRLVCYSSNRAKAQHDRLSFMFEHSLCSQVWFSEGFQFQKELFFFFHLQWCKWVTAVSQRRQKKKVSDVDALVCVCVSIYLQATRPVSSSPQSSQRESRLCGGSASNARLAAAVRIKERMRWVDEWIWRTGSLTVSVNALFSA